MNFFRLQIRAPGWVPLGLNLSGYGFLRLSTGLLRDFARQKTSNPNLLTPKPGSATPEPGTWKRLKLEVCERRFPQILQKTKNKRRRLGSDVLVLSPWAPELGSEDCVGAC